ncbi:unnamed protein product [Cylicocyclus nassatus]|uniref:Uncharacterized protein n=1 Tax=Cylicocyclus nassatus TaxID=53992 RepID=A0AA36H187_CYLNA|nr:unnamed protein product [Cylicocyclus nassatus]
MVHPCITRCSQLVFACLSGGLLPLIEVLLLMCRDCSLYDGTGRQLPGHRTDGRVATQSPLLVGSSFALWQSKIAIFVARGDRNRTN